MKPITYGSTCSGIEAATVAWHPLGWKPVFYSEIDKFPRAVLTHHYPAVPLHGDFTTIREGDYDPIDLLVGGTPCQDFSVAGLRKGFAGDRGNLTFEFVRLLERLRPEWMVWENVPGALSIDGGVGFGTFLGMLAKLGYGFAYRVLDAQYFDLAQRRARVFVVGHLGDWRRSAAVLFEPESLSGHPAPRRETGERPAPTISARPTGGGGLGTDFDCDGGLIAHSLRAGGFDASEDGIGRGTPLVPFNITPSNSNRDYNAREAQYAQAVTVGGNRPSARGGDLIAFSAKDYGADAGAISPTLRAGGHDKSHANAGVMPAIAIPILEVGKRTGASTNDPRAGLGVGENGDPMFTLQSGAQHGVAQAMAVRRLTPRECERLQGFPDDYTLIPYRNGFAADGPRYKALGNSMAVPVMAWIGKRIDALHHIKAQAA